MLPGTLRAFRFNLISLALFALSCCALAPRTLSCRSSWRARVACLPACLAAWVTGSASLLAARSSVICGMCNNLNYAHESENCQPGKTDKQQQQQQPRVLRVAWPKVLRSMQCFSRPSISTTKCTAECATSGGVEGGAARGMYILKFRRVKCN